MTKLNEALSKEFNCRVNISDSQIADFAGFYRETIGKIRQQKPTNYSSLCNLFEKLEIKITDQDYQEVSTTSKPKKSLTSLTQLKEALLTLNYKPQVRCFEDNLIPTEIKTRAFLIYGQKDHGQKWLVNRLSYSIPFYRINAVKKTIKLTKKRHYSNLGNLWQDLAKNLGIKDPSLDNLATKICQLAETTTVILCLHDLHVITDKDRQELFDFWQIITDKGQNCQRPIILFLTAEDKVTMTNKNQNYWFELDHLTTFEPSEISHWVSTNTQLFSGQNCDFDAIIKEIIDHNQTPVAIFSKIAEYLDLDWQEIERSLNL